ncbi:MAG: hypothetical protein HN820_06020 [Candidatus Marinimicrobia bacterium]|jgi:hypothetical membrane protein|nr:hypothetical protein [Candidatus Neomarinimicrobiota bacterium]MBT6870665.1 hypothetical protein [Candidatus Neomarinimicrobiota bacterium]MBT7377693.1 hypothetical protein [Candidatus Neomarinimicrobiota bacterium]|tara:strand:+ start:3529 stop:4242 length:714 start_codon:yes stop_codon:yes gene_type:complete
MFSWSFTSTTIKQLINIALTAYYAFIVVLLLAVYCYPGSTHRDDTTVGYSITHNFLSDLGRTITYSGAQNFLSSTLFVMGTTLVCAGLIAYFLVMPAIVNKSKLSKILSQVGSLAGILCGLAFMGVGFTPHNYYPDAHMFVVRFGFQLFLVVMLLHSVAIMKNEVGLSKKSVWIYTVFMTILCYYIYLLNWGPPIKEGNGLVIHVIWQKITVLGLSTTVFVQSLMLKNHIRALSQTS